VEGPAGRTTVDVFTIAHDYLDDTDTFVDAADTPLRIVGRHN
jgi:hypothetical protein